MKVTVGHMAVTGQNCQDQAFYVARNRNKRYLCSACCIYPYIYIYTFWLKVYGYSRKRDRYITDFQEGKVNWGKYTWEFESLVNTDYENIDVASHQDNHIKKNILQKETLRHLGIQKNLQRTVITEVKYASGLCVCLFHDLSVIRVKSVIFLFLYSYI